MTFLFVCHWGLHALR